MRLIGFTEPQDSSVWIGSVDDSEMLTPICEIEDFYRDLARWTSGSQEPQLAPRPLGEVTVVPAIRSSARILCVGLNYVEHAEEGGNLLPEFPTIFARWTASLAVTGAAVVIPVDEPGLDWEGELAVVVGRHLREVDEAEAAAGIFGYAVFNDLSARRAQLRTSQWTLGKNADASGAIGAVVTAEEAGSIEAGRRLVTRVNGEVMQDASTSDMIFSPSRLIAHISRSLTLNPGDVIVTGTPSGVGHHRQPPVFLQPGDEVTVDIEGLGSVTNVVAARSIAGVTS